MTRVKDIKVEAKTPSRFKKGSIERCHFDKLRSFVLDIRALDDCDYLLLEQGARLYAQLRRIEDDIDVIGNYVGDEDNPRKNPLISEYKAIQASYQASLRDIGFTLKDRKTFLVQIDTSTEVDY